MYLHEKELVTQVRVYESPEGYNNKVPYSAILTLQYIADDIVYIEGLRGEISIDFYKSLKNLLKSKNIKQAMYYRDTGELKHVKVS